MTECQEDFVGLWSVLWEIKKEYPSKTAAEQQTLTIEVAKALLDKGCLVGDLYEDKGFQPWSVPPREAILRIQTAWENLGREPTLGDIAWFTSPSLVSG